MRRRRNRLQQAGESKQQPRTMLGRNRRRLWEAATPEDQRKILVARLPWLPAFGTTFILIYAIGRSSLSFWTTWAVAGAVAAAAFALGMFLGFLFGIPRARAAQSDGGTTVVQQHGATPSQQPLRNHDQVSIHPAVNHRSVAVSST